MSYEMVIRSECGLEEPESVWATNLPVLPLHFLKVSWSVSLPLSSLRREMEWNVKVLEWNMRNGFASLVEWNMKVLEWNRICKFGLWLVDMIATG